MPVLDTLLSNSHAGWWLTDVYVGENWTLALVRGPDGQQGAGVAGTPATIPPDARFHIGHYALDTPAEFATFELRSSDLTASAVGLATINAMNSPDDSLIANADAADWLSARSIGRSIAVFGRFPFIEAEIRPQARQVWVFEQQPQAGEFDSTAIETILPQADIVALTSSTVINHTIDSILPYAKPDSTVVLLGPSTPLSPRLFDCGIDALFGVRVSNVQLVIESVSAGSDFQKMQGLERIKVYPVVKTVKGSFYQWIVLHS